MTQPQEASNLTENTNGKKHLPQPRGPHSVGFVDLLTSGDTGVLVRIYYPTKVRDVPWICKYIGHISHLFSTTRYKCTSVSQIYLILFFKDYKFTEKIKCVISFTNLFFHRNDEELSEKEYLEIYKRKNTPWNWFISWGSFLAWLVSKKLLKLKLISRKKILFFSF